MHQIRQGLLGAHLEIALAEFQPPMPDPGWANLDRNQKWNAIQKTAGGATEVSADGRQRRTGSEMGLGVGIGIPIPIATPTTKVMNGQQLGCARPRASASGSRHVGP